MTGGRERIAGHAWLLAALLTALVVAACGGASKSTSTPSGAAAASTPSQTASTATQSTGAATTPTGATQAAKHSSKPKAKHATKPTGGVSPNPSHTSSSSSKHSTHGSGGGSSTNSGSGSSSGSGNSGSSGSGNSGSSGSGNSGSSGSGNSGSSGSTKTKRTAPKPAPLSQPVVSASTAGMRASLHGPGHAPKVGKLWHYSVLATDPSGHALTGKVDTEFVFNGQVVGHESPPTHPLKNGRLNDAVTFPAQSAGIPLTFRVVVHTSAGTLTLNWSVKVQH